MVLKTSVNIVVNILILKIFNSTRLISIKACRCA